MVVWCGVEVGLEVESVAGEKEEGKRGEKEERKAAASLCARSTEEGLLNSLL